MAAELDGQGLASAGHRRMLVLLNAGTEPATLALPAARGQAWALHPVQRAPGAADRRVATQARFDRASGSFVVPARSAAVWVLG